MNRLLRISALTALHAALILLHASCVREDTSDCLQYEVNLRVTDAEGNDLTGNGVLEKAEVYLFGEKGFVRMVPTGVSSDYLFGGDKHERLTLVAWGNVKADTLITAEIAPGTSIEDARLKLRQHAGGSHLPVTDLFYGRKELNNAATRSMQEESVTLVLERMAAELTLRTLCMAERYPYDGTGYTFVVRGTGCEMNFLGSVAGEESGYRPPTVTDNQGDAYTPPFRIFPTEEGECIEVDIYKGREKLCTIAQDGKRQPLCAAAGKRTDIVIDFRYAEIKAFVKVLDWGEVEQETEM